MKSGNRRGPCNTSQGKEGFERTGGPEKLHFDKIARASCGEVPSLLYVITDNCPKSSEDALKLMDLAINTGKILSGLIASSKRRLKS